MSPEYVWNVLRLASHEWVNICEWHSAVKHFHSSQFNSPVLFSNPIFKTGFMAARAHALGWVKEEKSLRGADWKSKEISDEMKKFFTHNEEGIVLYCTLQQHRTAFTRHLENWKALSSR
jgi:hypothetical protein